MEGRTRWNRSPELRILILLFAAATAMQAVRPTASYRTLELGGTPAAVGLVTASYGALAAIAAVPCGRLIDRLGPRRFLLGGLAVLVASYTLGAAAPTILTLAGSQALVGLGQISTVLAVQTIIANRPDPGPRIRQAHDRRRTRAGTRPIDCGIAARAHLAGLP